MLRDHVCLQQFRTLAQVPNLVFVSTQCSPVARPACDWPPRPPFSPGRPANARPGASRPFFGPTTRRIKATSETVAPALLKPVEVFTKSAPASRAQSAHPNFFMVA